MTLLSKKKAIKAVSIKKEQLLKYLEHLGECEGKCKLSFNDKGQLVFEALNTNTSNSLDSDIFTLYPNDISACLSSRRRDEYEYEFYPKGEDEILITEQKLKSNRHEERKRKKKLKSK